MTGTALTGRILQWGNSYGIRIKKADLERAGLKPGQEAIVHIEAPGGRIDLSRLPTFRSGTRDTSKRHDAAVGAAREAGLGRRTGPHRGEKDRSE